MKLLRLLVLPRYSPIELVGIYAIMNFIQYSKWAYLFVAIVICILSIVLSELIVDTERK